MLQLNPVKRVKGERHYLIKIAVAGVFTLYMEGGQYLTVGQPVELIEIDESEPIHWEAKASIQR